MTVTNRGKRYGLSRLLLATACCSGAAVTAQAATITWTGAATGSWSEAAKWTSDTNSNVVPTTGDTVLIDNGSAQNTTVTFNGPTGATPFSAGVDALSISAGDTLKWLTFSSGTGHSVTLTVATTLDNAGVISLSTNRNDDGASLTYQGTGTTFNTGSIQLSTGTSAHGKSAGFTVMTDNTNAGTISVAASSGDTRGNTAALTLNGTGTFVNDGTVTLSGNFVSSRSGTAALRISAPDANAIAVTISGNGNISLSDNAANSITKSGNINAAAMLVLGSGQTLTGAGTIGTGSMDIGLEFTNQGVVKATGTSALVFDPGRGQSTNGTVSNVGFMAATGSGGMTFQGGVYNNTGALEARSGSTINVSTTATLNSGSGQISGAGTYIIRGGAGTLAAATLKPGDSTADSADAASTVGWLTITGSVSLGSDSTLSWQAGTSDSAGTTYDTVSISGNLILDGTLSLATLAGFPDENDFTTARYTLFNVAGSVTDNGLVLDSDRFRYEITPGGNGSTDVVLVVPEPASAILLELCAAGLLGIRRKRRVRSSTS